MKILITGCAGFIGFHTAIKVLKKNYTVIGIDNLNHYYDVNLKKDRLKILKKYSNFIFVKVNIENKFNSNFLSDSIKVIGKNKMLNSIFKKIANDGIRF